MRSTLLTSHAFAMHLEASDEAMAEVVSQCRQDNSQAPLNTANVKPYNAQQAKKQKAERLANAELIFAFAQLRANNLRNDPQKCQKTPQMTQVENTIHQKFKSI